MDTHTITTACGANGAKVTGSDTYDAGTGAGSFQCFFADGPATTNVTATVTDSDGATDTDNQVVVVTVNNVAPVVTLAAGNDLSVDEGSQHTYNFTVSDPGADTFTVVERRAAVPTAPRSARPRSPRPRCGQLRLLLPRRPGQLEHVVGAGQGLRRRAEQHRHPDRDGRQRGPDGDPGRRATTCRSTRAASTPTSFTVSDPGADTFTVVSVSCGANGTQVGSTTTTASGGSFVCSFPDGPATSARVGAGQGLRRRAEQHRHPDRDAWPTWPRPWCLSGADSADEGSTKTYTYTVTDPGDRAGDDHRGGGLRCQRHPDRHPGRGQLRLHLPRRPEHLARCRSPRRRRPGRQHRLRRDRRDRRQRGAGRDSHQSRDRGERRPDEALQLHDHRSCGCR